MSKRNENRQGYKKTPVGWIPEEWNVSLINTLGEVITGTTPSKNELSNYGDSIPWCTAIDMQGKYVVDTSIKLSKKGAKKARILPQGAVLITCIASIGKNAIAKVPLATNQQINAIIVNSNNHNEFIYYALSQKENELRRIAGQTAVPIISKSVFSKFKIATPRLNEQIKISQIISSWDRSIDKIQQLISIKRRLKKSLMQKLLTGRMRFPEFGLAAKHKGELPIEWKQTELNTIFKIIKRKNSKECKHVLTASGQNGLIDQKDYFNRSVAGNNLSNYYLLERGEFAYNRSAMKGFPYGAIKRLEKYDEGILSTLYLCFNLKSKTVDSDFINYYFESGLFNIQLRKIIEVGARAHGLLNITATDFMHLQVQLPEQIEQTEISKILSLIDNEIDCLKRKESILSIQRKELLNKLLSGSIRVKINNGR